MVVDPIIVEIVLDGNVFRLVGKAVEEDAVLVLGSSGSQQQKKKNGRTDHCTVVLLLSLLRGDGFEIRIIQVLEQFIL